MNFHKTKPVTIIDPDLEIPTLVQAWEQYVDKATGHHMVVIEGEPEALRRIKPQNISPCPYRLSRRL